VNRRTAFQGIGAFALIWLGQLVSLIGSGLTSFALSVWAYQTTESATAYALVVLATMGPNVLLSLVIGPLIDRWDRRWVMVLSDAGSGLSTLVVYLLFVTGQLSLWPVLLATAVSSAFSAFQWPAYAAATTMLVPKKHLGRANGLIQLAEAVGYIASPALAGFLLIKIQIQGVILIDFLTFLFAVIALFLIQIPRPELSSEGGAEKGSWWRELLFGLSYLAKRRGLIGVLSVFAFTNFLLGLVMALFGPMVLSFANADVLGSVTSIGALGMLIGGGLMSLWGGPKRRVYGVLGFLLLQGLAFTLAGLRPSLPLITFAAFSFFFCFPISNASNQAIWQSKVSPDVQGRVFALRSAIVTCAMPIAYAIAGPLADYVFEPLLVVGGPLAGSVGRIVGVGEGRGIGLLFVAAGALAMLVTIGSFLHPRIRLLEDELPDAVSEVGEASDRGAHRVTESAIAGETSVM
jgi:DHA3 family macrolide efflux protein-like MFS transporter